jgi:hypothetical protein
MVPLAKESPILNAKLAAICDHIIQLGDIEADFSERRDSEETQRGLGNLRKTYPYLQFT